MGSSVTGTTTTRPFSWRISTSSIPLKNFLGTSTPSFVTFVFIVSSERSPLIPGLPSQDARSQTFDPLGDRVERGEVVLGPVEVEVGAARIVVVALELAVLRGVHLDQPRAGAVELAALLDELLAAVGR